MSYTAKRPSYFIKRRLANGLVYRPNRRARGLEQTNHLNQKQAKELQVIPGTDTPDLHDRAPVEVFLVLLEVCHILQLPDYRLQKTFGSRLHDLETWGDIVPPKRRQPQLQRAVNDSALPVPPAAGMWPRVIREAGYDELGNLVIGGIDDNDRGWHEAVTGRGQEAWLLKQLYVERRFGRRNKRYSLKKKPAR